MKKIIIILIFGFISLLNAYEAICTFNNGFKVKIKVSNTFMKQYNINTGEQIGKFKYLGMSSTNYYIYGENPEDIFVDIYLGAIDNKGDFKYFRVGNIGNRSIQWEGICKIK